VGDGPAGEPVTGRDDLFDVTADGVVLRVHVQPRAGRDVITGRHGDALKVRVTAAPTGGLANDAVARQLAGAFLLAPSAVVLVSGRTSRAKRFLLTGVGAADARRRLAELVAADPGTAGAKTPAPGAR
jgi:uncharacterized protein